MKWIAPVLLLLVLLALGVHFRGKGDEDPDDALGT